ncbi:MAG: YfhO family protein [Candidatus Aenigmarchaeota archaeon]|nr:YfhO family protein [Candidatus Aenigmarchaeota archaeon]
MANTLKTDLISITFIFLLSITPFLPYLVQSGKVLGSGISDTVYILPFIGELSRKELTETGFFPTWDSYTSSGRPFLANPQSAPFSLSTLLYLLFSFNSFAISTAIYMFLAGIFTYLFSRLLDLKQPEALFASISYMFSSLFFLRIFAGHTLLIGAFAFFPLILLIAELNVRKTRKLHIILFGSIAFFLQISTGGLQIAFYTTIAFFLYTILRSVQRFLLENSTKQLLKNIVAPLLMIAISIMMVSSQLLPAFELLSLSPRANSDGTSVSTSSHPLLLSNLFLPEILSSSNYNFGFTNFWEFIPYIGAITAIMALLGCLFSSRKIKYPLIILALFSILFSLGTYTPFFSLFSKVLPFINSFRFPSRMIFVFLFSLSILSSLGFHSLLQKSTKKLFHVPLFIVSIVFLLVSILLTNPAYIILKEQFTHISAVIAGSLPYDSAIIKASAIEQNFQFIYANIVFGSYHLLIFLVLFLWACSSFIKGRLTPRIFSLAILLLLLSDLLLFGIPYIKYTDQKSLELPQDALKYIDSDYNVYLDKAVFPPVALIKNNLKTHQIYDPATLKSYEEFLSINNCTEYCSSASNLFSTKYYITNKTLDMEKLYSFSYTNYLTGKPSIATIYSINSSGLARISYNWRVDSSYLGDVYLDKLEFSDDSKINITYRSSSKINISTYTSQSGVLVLSQNYYPGWKVFIDDKEARILQPYASYTGVFLPRGQHNVEFAFNPYSGLTVTLIGTIISLISFFTLLLLYIF